MSKIKSNETEKKMNFGLILVVYLLGIFMGALDTGIVTPARTIIQESLGVGETTGIWMITIYTLAYAASIPVMGKLADRAGRRNVYLISILLFGTGSLFCGLSHSFNSFTVLLVSRAIQAIGGGGIVPIATAEFGTTFPEEKRGMALGMVGGVYGVANVFGASAGSAVMDIFGTDRWEFIFYVNVPIAVFILVAGFFCLPNTKVKEQKPIDGMGTCLLVVMVLSLMYGLKNIDFFDFKNSITDPKVFGFLLGFLVLLPFFIYAENRAADPVMNLKYFKNPKIVMTLGVTIISGIIMMGMVFIPQFCENALRVPSGSGGYFVIILGVCAGVGAMGSGKLTDKYGPVKVLAIGLIAAIIGALIIILFATRTPNRFNVFASLIFIGLGIGFTMGAPLNYMMLGEVDEKESNSALATLSLVRSLGTVVAPAIMVGFIAHAGQGMAAEIMKVMPTEVNMPDLPYVEELSDAMEEQNVEGMPDLKSMTSMEINMSEMSSNSDFKMPEELLKELQNSDVTTIVKSTKHMASYMFDQMMPTILDKINGGMGQGISSMNSAIAQMNDSISQMRSAQAGMEKAIEGMNAPIKQKEAMEAQVAKLSQDIDEYQRQIQELTPQIPATADQIAELGNKIGACQGQMAGIKQGIAAIEAQIPGIKSKQNEMRNSINQMNSAIAGIETGQSTIQSNIDKMNALLAAMPNALQIAKENYLKAIDKKAPEIENVYQKTLNVGFRQIYIMTAIGSAVGLLLLGVYSLSRKKETE